MAQAIYVEAHDALMFPTFRTYESLIGTTDARIRRMDVVIVNAEAEDLNEKPGWKQPRTVLSGHLRVADKIIEAWLTVDPHKLVAATEEWISKSHAADAADRSDREAWFREHRLLEDPVRRDRLYDHAGLTQPQLIAMRLVYGDPPRALRAVALELGISEGALTDRLERAKTKLREALSDS